jgi:hypothetical protein
MSLHNFFYSFVQKSEQANEADIAMCGRENQPLLAAMSFAALMQAARLSQRDCWLIKTGQNVPHHASLGVAEPIQWGQTRVHSIPPATTVHTPSDHRCVDCPIQTK